MDDKVRVRKIDPENKPGAKPKFGTVLTRTVIVKLTDDQFAKLEQNCLAEGKNKNDYFRDRI